MSAQRADEPLPNGLLSVHHFIQAIHRHLFQDVYPWAGIIRTVRISRDGGSVVTRAYSLADAHAVRPIATGALSHDLTPDEFVLKATTFLATLNAIHPFRDGNGSTQLAFMALLAARAGHSLLLRRLHARRFLNAMVRTFAGDQRPLQIELRKLVD